LSSPNPPEPFPSNLCPDIRIQSLSRLPVLPSSARHTRPARVLVQSRSPPRFPPSLSLFLFSFFFFFFHFLFPFFLFVFLPSSFLLLPTSALSRTRGAEHASTRSTPAAPCHPASLSRRAARLPRRPRSRVRQRAEPRASPAHAAGHPCTRPHAALLAVPPAVKLHSAACPARHLPELSRHPVPTLPPTPPLRDAEQHSSSPPPPLKPATKPAGPPPTCPALHRLGRL